MSSRTILAVAAAGTAALAATLVPAAAPAAANTAPGSAATGIACSVDYRTSDWGGGFTAGVTITDTGTTAISGWTLTYAYSGDQTLQNGWNGTWSQSGKNITVTNPAWAPTIAAGGNYATSANFSYSGPNTAPTAFAVNGTPCGGTAPSAGAPQLHVSGNQLADSSGKTITLHGVNRSGAEFSCVQGTGIFDGPTDQTSVTAMTSWHISAVRVPLNEDCWLGLPDVNSAYAGGNYINAVKSYVSLLERNGLDVILDLHWTDGVYTGPSSGCSSTTATCQKPMPDAAEAVPFWTSVANAFKGDDAVLFDLFNEPYPERATGSEASGWNCWLDGGTCPGIGYQVAGMQTLVDAVRGTGADNVVMLGGLAYANDLTSWLDHEPTDPDHNLVASWHSYNFNSCADDTCWADQIAPVAARVPLVTGELGENDCGTGYLGSLLPWLDTHGVSYLAWTWNTWDCSSGPALISDYDGTATAYGAGYKAHLAALAG
ncbi:cellulase family glycosylhydrolase [Streptantibioticus cattleyicolor]|uniref:Endoglucanase n=1 Tax=Streptantibioticus cattleyicolor (strain ATCC 35852 / DSM 46488 / JCM 4925 / NBRC 14057 / NRRL 8057) TaxID=1003195 RepID=F8JK10_STREN|nr:cellulase family glycosylhydrolase [Streptantibioticus cattleyicolor]AEW99855.1 cellulose-binding family II [Streptantibioticus cattleyicolor NRRL 8057 = DSM 46488]CCB71109.1 Cellulase (Glycosyl hydrolase family 5) with CBM domain [Streptantibioticus cattleyicolor NRRL 8057 = DSM 46488]